MRWKKINEWFDWRKTYKFRIASGIAGLIIISFMAIQDSILRRKKGLVLAHEKMINLKDTIDSEVLEIVSGKAMAEVRFSDGKIKYTRFARNLAYNPQDIETFLKKGDKLVKSAGVDTIKIIRNDSTFYFVIGKTIP
jgi:hypothetical protein